MVKLCLWNGMTCMNLRTTWSLWLVRSIHLLCIIPNSETLNSMLYICNLGHFYHIWSHFPPGVLCVNLNMMNLTIEASCDVALICDKVGVSLYYSLSFLSIALINTLTKSNLQRKTFIWFILPRTIHQWGNMHMNHRERLCIGLFSPIYAHPASLYREDHLPRNIHNGLGSSTTVIQHGSYV